MKRFLKFLLIPVLLSGCSDDKPTPAAINETIVRTNARVNARAVEFGNVTRTAVKDNNYRLLQLERTKLLETMNAAIDTIAAIENTGGSEALKACELEYLHLEKKYVDDALAAYVQLSKGKTKEEVKAGVKAMREMGEREQAYLARLSALQTAFAKKNNFQFIPVSKSKK